MSMTVNNNNLNQLFSGVFGWNNNNNSSSLFDSTSNFGINLTDYATIKSGSYRKLLKAYYAKNPDETKKTQDTFKKDQVQTQKEKTKILAKVENSADEAKEAADALLVQGNKSVFTKVEKTDDKGNKTTEYDTDAIYKAVDRFVSSYNSMLERAENVSYNSITNAADTAVRYTKVNEKALEKIGIAIDSDSKLSLDKETFGKADMEQVKALFGKTGSYGYQISAKASMISFYAERAASQTVGYKDSGAYSYTYRNGGLYDIGI